MTSSRQLRAWKNAPYSFFIEECGGAGDCLFFVLAQGLTRTVGLDLKMDMIRVLLANSVDATNIKTFVQAIAADQATHQLPGSVSFGPLNVWLQENESQAPQMIRHVKQIIRKSGTGFQGTDEVLRWFVNHSEFFISRKVGFVVFSAFGPDFITKIDRPETESYLLLYNAPNVHWQLANLLTHDQTGYCSITPLVWDSILQASKEFRVR